MTKGYMQGQQANMKSKSLSYPVPVRLPEHLQDEMEELSKNYGISKADLIRNAIAMAVPKWQKDGIVLYPVGAHP